MSETHTSTRAAGHDQASRLVRLRLSSLGAVVMLIIQFVLGIIYNLYGTAPTSAKSVGLFSSPDLALHVILGILLVIAAVGQLIRAITVRHRLSIWMSAAGASLGMSLAFAVALACYVVLVSALPSSAGPSSAGPSSAAPSSAGPWST